MSNIRAKSVALAAISLAAINACAQEDRSISGSFEYFATAANSSDFQARTRIERVKLDVNYDAFQATVSYWWYPYCKFQTLHETNVSYTKGPTTVRYGRFMPTFGQSDWYDQWYSGFVFMPDIEEYYFGGDLWLFSTFVGASLEHSFGNSKLTVAAIDPEVNSERATPAEFSRATARIQTFAKDTVYGASYYGDTKHDGREVSIYSADFRYSRPHWIVRGEGIVSMSTGDRTRGFNLEVSHRPAGWNDVTLLFRGQQLASRQQGYEYARKTITLGAKVRLPFDCWLFANDIIGSGDQFINYRAGWAFSFIKTIRF